MTSYTELISVFEESYSFLTMSENLLDRNRLDLINILFKLPNCRVYNNSYNILRNHVMYDTETSLISIIDLSLTRDMHVEVIRILLDLGYELHPLLKRYDLLHLLKRV